MDNRYYDNVIAEMKPFLDEQGFALEADGSFKNDKKQIKVEYNEARQMFLLLAAEPEGEYKEINAWLFDDSQTERDAEAVGIDFCESLRGELGARKTRNISAQIDLPTAKDSSTVTGFAKKVLDVYPQFKDAYKAHIMCYGNFLYLEFFSTTLVPQIKQVLTSGNKKSVKKLSELLSTAYTEGDKATTNTAVAVLAAAASGDAATAEAARAMLADNSHFLQAFNNLLPIVEKNKKINNALVK